MAEFLARGMFYSISKWPKTHVFTAEGHLPLHYIVSPALLGKRDPRYPQAEPNNFISFWLSSASTGVPAWPGGDIGTSLCVYPV